MEMKRNKPTEIFKFDEIKIIKNKLYDIQAKLIQVPKIINGSTTKIASLILSDITGTWIELIAWGKNAEHIEKQNIVANGNYIFKKVEAISNTKYQKTKHAAKLVFEFPISSIKKVKHLEYKINDKVYVLNEKNAKLSKKINEKNNKNRGKCRQSSIRNWFR